MSDRRKVFVVKDLQPELAVGMIFAGRSKGQRRLDSAGPVTDDVTNSRLVRCVRVTPRCDTIAQRHEWAGRDRTMGSSGGIVH